MRGHGAAGQMRRSPFNLNEFQLGVLAAVEYYPTTDLLPTDFPHTANRCGAVLLWSRER